MTNTRRDFLRNATLAATTLGLARGTSTLARAADSTTSSLPEALPRMLVLGGTGFLGLALVRDALANYDAMTALCEKAAELSPPPG